MSRFENRFSKLGPIKSPTEYAGTILSIPGMNETVKMDFKILRKNVLLLNSVIKRGLSPKDDASSIGCKPTIENLEKKFAAHEPAREALKQRTKKTIDECLQIPERSMKDLVAQLDRKQIYTVLRQNSEGRLYGVTFVDNLNKCVFNGSDIGKNYSAAALQSRLVNINTEQKEIINDKVNQQPVNPLPIALKNKITNKFKTGSRKDNNLLNNLLSTKEQYENVPFQLIKKKSKKKEKEILIYNF